MSRPPLCSASPALRNRYVRHTAITLHVGDAVLVFAKLPTHSRSKTPKRRRGPKRLNLSKVAAVAFDGIHSGNCVIILAIGFIDTKASKPARIPRHVLSAPARLSGRANEGCSSRTDRTTGPSTSASSPGSSNRLARSCRNKVTSPGPSVSGEVEDDRRGAERAEIEIKGTASSTGPSCFL